MGEAKTEIAARYHVVQLLYRGKLNEAELSLNSFSRDKAISPANEAFYRSLLEQARKHGPTDLVTKMKSSEELFQTLPED